MKRIKEYYTLLQTDCSGKIADLINTRYAHSLFRRNGFHRYADADGEFIAHLLRVEPDGRFILEDQTGKERGYLFKEVQYIP
jgi:BirA family biotin operon repressor/biotin-[acetyl-CoA-carboxylase] ligase